MDRYIAAAFGAVLCAVLVYFIVHTPQMEPAERFWLIRVIASLCGAGVGAVVPGFLITDISLGKSIAIRAGGAAALGVMIYNVNPPTLPSRANSARPSAEIMMISNYTSGLYEEAERQAEEILRSDQSNATAWNIRGGIAYYSKNYTKAIEYFTRALQIRDSKQFRNNLAYSQIEVGAYRLAIENFMAIQDGSSGWNYSIGRAYYYSGDYEKAIRHLEAVPADYWHGAGRILLAAAELASGTAGAEDRARGLVRQAVNLDRSYWAQIANNPLYDKSQSFSIPLERIERILRETLQQS